jgi:transmembrane protein
MSFDLHAGHSLLQILAHVCIAFLFLYRGITAFPQFGEHMETMRSHRVPFPKFVLYCGFAVMLLGGLSVLFDFYVWIGARMLVVFTVLANVLYHDFWVMTEPRQKQTHLWIFCNNIAVTGGLLLVISL